MSFICVCVCRLWQSLLVRVWCLWKWVQWPPSSVRSSVFLKVYTNIKKCLLLEEMLGPATLNQPDNQFFIYLFWGSNTWHWTVMSSLSGQLFHEQSSFYLCWLQITFQNPFVIYIQKAHDLKLRHCFSHKIISNMKASLAILFLEILTDGFKLERTVFWSGFSHNMCVCIYIYHMSCIFLHFWQFQLWKFINHVYPHFV